MVTTDTPYRSLGRAPDGRFASTARPPTASGWRSTDLAGPVDWVVSGINAGGNLGADVHHSGTVAAVREAVIHGFRGVAFSHYIARGRPIDWESAGAVDRAASSRLLARRPESGTFWNVNLPDPGPGVDEPEVVFCPVDASPLPLAYREQSQAAWSTAAATSRAPRRPGGDVAVCFGGRIAVSKVHVMASIWPIDD